MKLSIVIASGAGGDFLSHCLESLQEQLSDDVEVIVVDRTGEKTVRRLQREYPFAHVLSANCDHRPSVPELRALGVKQARGEIVAILEEHCLAPSGWVEAIRASFRPGDSAIGGPILNQDYGHLRDWVVYFSEYHNYLPPWQPGNRYALNGANIAYDRQKLIQYVDTLDNGYWEVVLHPLLAREGNFRAVPEMGVYHSGPFPFLYYLRQRYLLSRVWGGTQREQASPFKRGVYLITAPALPALLLVRIARRVMQAKHRLDKFVAALPLLIPVTITYVWGEWLGYLLGIGSALERVE